MKKIIISTFILAAGSSFAQSNDELHEKCKDAKDYVGCVTFLSKPVEEAVQPSVTWDKNSVTFVGYTIDQIKSQFIPKFQNRNPKAQVSDNGYTLTFTQYSVQGDSITASLYTVLLGNSYSKLDALSIYNFNQKDKNTIVVTPQAFLRLTNAFGQPETNPNLAAIPLMTEQMYKDFTE